LEGKKFLKAGNRKRAKNEEPLPPRALPPLKSRPKSSIPLPGLNGWITFLFFLNNLPLKVKPSFHNLLQFRPPKPLKNPPIHPERGLIK